MQTNDKERRLAVLIDSDNVSSKYVGAMMEEIARYGTPTIKRIYGDWTALRDKGWKKVLLENAISPMQQYSYTTGKNSTDSAMIIDAMDILYSDKVDGFFIFFSDSDFTRLATRLREAGVTVIGIGEKKTPPSFIAACEKFIFLEILVEAKEKGEHAERLKTAEKPAEKPRVQGTNIQMQNLLVTSVNDVANEEGWASLSEVGQLIIRKQPSFDSRNYGYVKLSSLVKSTGLFETEMRETSASGGKQLFVRDKNFSQNEK